MLQRRKVTRVENGPPSYGEWEEATELTRPRTDGTAGFYFCRDVGGSELSSFNGGKLVTWAHEYRQET